MIDPNSVQMRKLAKHVLLAAKKQQDQQQSIDVLSEHVKKVKKLAKTKTLKKAIEELEEKVNLVLEKEGKILIKEDSSKEQMLEMESRLNQASKRDAEMIESLRSQINELETELKNSERTRTMQTMENKQRLTSISSITFDLKDKLNQALDAKTSHDKRVLELEKKIKHKLGKNYQEIIKFEMHLNEMENKYELMRKEGKYDKSMLEEVEEKILHLRKRLFLKKEGISPPKEKMYIAEIERKPSKKPIRHTLRMGTVPKPPEHLDFGEIPPIPPPPNLFQKPKKSFFQKIFNN
jgi:hypothetical protein